MLLSLSESLRAEIFKLHTCDSSAKLFFREKDMEGSTDRETCPYVFSRDTELNSEPVGA